MYCTEEDSNKESKYLFEINYYMLVWTAYLSLIFVVNMTSNVCIYSFIYSFV